MKKTDAIIQQDVIDALAAESDLDAATIGVAVKNRMVRLVGCVTNLADQQTAERAAYRVAAARGIVDDLKVESIVTARARPLRKDAANFSALTTRSYQVGTIGIALGSRSPDTPSGRQAPKSFRHGDQVMANSSPEFQTPRPFLDRREAGRLLASRLREFANRSDVVVLALPRGGVPVAYEVALALGVPLDVFTVRKLGVPGHKEFAMGAIGSGGVYVLNYAVIDALHISQREVVQIAERERKELERRERLYREDRPYPTLEGKIVVLVDDGLATGASMLVAVNALREKHPAKIVVSVPVAPPETCSLLREQADEAICYATPEPFGGVGAWYEDFSQVTDEEVRALLNQAALRRAS